MALNDDVQVHTDQDIEDALAAKLGGTEKPEKPAKVESVEEDSTEGQPETEEEAADEGQAESEVEDPNLEDREIEGEVFRLPKKVAKIVDQGVDYTKKTMRAADELRLAQQEREAVKIHTEFNSKYAPMVAELQMMESRIKQFEAVDWMSLATSDPAQTQALQAQYFALERQYQRKQGEVQQAVHEFQREIENRKQQKLAVASQMLKNEFGDKASEISAKLKKTGENFGFTNEELSSIDDARMVRVLNAARQWMELQTAKPQVHKRADLAKPVKVATSRSAQSTQSVAQIDGLRANLKKTGSSQAAEDLFTKLLSRKR